MLCSDVGPIEFDGKLLGFELGATELVGDDEALVVGLMLCSIVGPIDVEGDDEGNSLGESEGLPDG